MLARQPPAGACGPILLGSLKACNRKNLPNHSQSAYQDHKKALEDGDLLFLQ